MIVTFLHRCLICMLGTEIGVSEIGVWDRFLWDSCLWDRCPWDSCLWDRCLKFYFYSGNFFVSIYFLCQGAFRQFNNSHLKNKIWKHCLFYNALKISFLPWEVACPTDHLHMHANQCTGTIGIMHDHNKSTMARY